MNEKAIRAFEPANFDEAMKMAQALWDGKLLTKGLPNAAAVLSVIMIGRELGLTACHSLRAIHIMDGKPAMSADLICGLVKNREDCEYFRPTVTTEEVATYETKRAGEPEPTSYSFTMEDARRAGLASREVWKKYPAAMLRARCITALARMVYPDATAGIYDPDELSKDEAPKQEPTPRKKIDPAVVVATIDKAVDMQQVEAIKRRLDAMQGAFEPPVLAKIADCIAAKIKQLTPAAQTDPPAQPPSEEPAPVATPEASADAQQPTESPATEPKAEVAP